jgi:hypothetical protein
MLTRSHWEILATALTSALIGAMLTVVQYRDRQFTARDMVEAHEQGARRALDVERGGERLEAVCAALWLRGQNQPVDQK